MKHKKHPLADAHITDVDAKIDTLAHWVDDNTHALRAVHNEANVGWKLLLDGSDTVRKFIAETGSILYGGTAIDLALRLVGDHIYPDDEAPDLDFFHPDNVEAAYSLADIFYRAGNETARAINAIHVKTMRVDISGGIQVADVSYCPRQVFDEIPYLMTQTTPPTKIVHPVFQRVDMHSALALPYDNAPREVIFHRWRKDLCRFNKLAAAYPTDTIRGEWFTETTITPMQTSRATIRENPFCGWTALACVSAGWITAGGDHSILRIVKPAVIVDGMVEFQTPRKLPEYLTDEPIEGAVQYEPYFTQVHGRFESADGIWWYPEGRLTTITHVNINGTNITCVSAQFLLYYFLGLFFQYRVADPKLAAVHLAAYEDVLAMTNVDNPPSCVGLSTEAYGKHNETLGMAVMMNRMMNDIDGTKLFTTPVNYYPARSINNPNGHPKFDPESSHIFRELGRPVSL